MTLSRCAPLNLLSVPVTANLDTQNQQDSSHRIEHVRAKQEGKAWEMREGSGTGCQIRTD